MSYTKITQADLKSRGATTLPNQPAISAQELKEEFDAPAKQIVAYAVNRLIDELEAATAAGSMGATAPQGFVGTTVQALLDAIGSAVKSLQASQVGATAPSGQTGDDVQGVIDSIGGDISSINENISSINEDITSLNASAHTHSNKALLDTYAQTETDLADAVSKKHSHSNKSTLDKLSEDSSGNPTFDGHTIPTSGQVGGFQKYIGQENLTPPSGSGEEGDLTFFGGEGEECKDLYRCDSTGYTKVSLTHFVEGIQERAFSKIILSQSDLGEGEPLDSDTLYLVYEA